MSDPQAARGPAKDFCPEHPNDPHHIASHSTGNPRVPFVGICMFCRWIDPNSLEVREPETNPVRTLESHGIVYPEPCEDEHRMFSVKVDGTKVRYVERCEDCGWIDGSALDWWAENAIKESLSERAQRIAVAIETEPFAFAQSAGQELSIEEICFQALGAASVCWSDLTLRTAGQFDSRRAKAVGEALLREVNRSIELARAAKSS
jgi:hypothetical protein